MYILCDSYRLFSPAVEFITIYSKIIINLLLLAQTAFFFLKKNYTLRSQLKDYAYDVVVVVASIKILNRPPLSLFLLLNDYNIK